MIAISKEPADQLPSVMSDNYQSGSERVYQLVRWWRYRAIQHLNTKSTFIKSENTAKTKKYENEQLKTRQPIYFKDKTHQEQAHWTSWSPRIQKRR